MFSTNSKKICCFSVKFVLSYANAINLVQSKSLSFGKGLKIKANLWMFKAVIGNPYKPQLKTALSEQKTAFSSISTKSFAVLTHYQMTKF